MEQEREWLESFEWDGQKYGLGLVEIDSHHKQLFSLINELRAAIESGNDEEGLKNVLPKLLSYARFHFSAEEYFMAKYSYGEFKEHRSEHMEFLRTMNENMQKFNEGKATLSIQLFVFLSNWIVDHIGDVDNRLAPFLKENGVL